MIRAFWVDTSIYSLSALLSKGLAIILLPLYTRVLSTEEFGAYELLIVFGVIANITIALEVSQGLARSLADSVGNSAARYHLVSSAFAFTVSMYAIFFAICMGNADWFTNFIFGDERYESIFRLGVGFISANGIYALLLNQFRWDLRARAYAVVSVFYGFLTIFFTFVFCILFDFGLVGVVLAQLISALMGCFLCLVLMKGRIACRMDLVYLRPMLRFSLPLVPSGIFLFVTLYVNRVVLGHLGELDDVGIFSYGSRLAGIVGLAILGVQSALTPLIYQNYHRSHAAFDIAKIFHWFIAGALVLCLFLNLFSVEITLFIASAEFIQGAALVSLLAPTLLFSQLYIFAPGISIARRTGLQLGITAISAIICSFASLIFIPLWGIWGAASASALASFIFFVMWFYVSQKLYYIPYQWGRVALAFFGYVFVSFCNLFLVGEHFLLVKLILLILYFSFLSVLGLFRCSDFEGLWRFFEGRKK